MDNIETIQEFTFFISGYFRMNYDVNYKDKIAKFSAHNFVFDTNTIEKKISSEAIDNFINKLNKLNVLNWSANYDNKIYDGKQWKIAIKFNKGKKFKSYGSNQYPGNERGDSEQSQQFIDLLAEINVLIGEVDFFKQ